MSQPASLPFGVKLLLVFLGGCVGTGLRHALDLLGGGYASTLIINALGAFLLGLFTSWMVRFPGPRGGAYRLFIATGMLGSFTTYSAYAVGWAAEEEHVAARLVAALVLLLIGLLMTALGLRLGRRDD